MRSVSPWGSQSGAGADKQIGHLLSNVVGVVCDGVGTGVGKAGRPPDPTMADREASLAGVGQRGPSHLIILTTQL